MSNVDYPDWQQPATTGSGLPLPSTTTTIPVGGSLTLFDGPVGTFNQLTILTSISAAGSARFSAEFYADAAFTEPVGPSNTWGMTQDSYSSVTTIGVVGPYMVLSMTSTGLVGDTVTAQIYGAGAAIAASILTPPSVIYQGGPTVSSGSSTTEGPFGAISGRGVLSGGCLTQAWHITLQTYFLGLAETVAIIGGAAGQFFTVDVLIPPGEVQVILSNGGASNAVVFASLVAE